ncbi:hypothetical protein QNH36_19220 [Mesobacillus sp. AQ2]|uniref:hypothetical protein n=1 Tax=Bacillaceae TaxID=186817 RepID=UPI00119D8ECC|nr:MULTISPECIES: hypothetical protein [Bacillaceae]WHX39759.1 hypothetical protein QNH36_19220 [Mesobacillus sp. AQ2]
MHRASISSVYSTGEGFQKESVFAKAQILQAREQFNGYYTAGAQKLIDGDKSPSTNPFNKELTRIGRSMAFIKIARGESVLPLKIFNYCTALECLFTNDNSEVSHQVAERAALLLGSNTEKENLL